MMTARWSDTQTHEHQTLSAFPPQCLGSVCPCPRRCRTAALPGELFRPAYRDRGLSGENLSRSIEDSVTLVEPLLPWTVSALFMATTLGVPTLAYAPWALFCLGGPVFSLLIAALAGRTGWGIRSRRGTAPQ